MAGIFTQSNYSQDNLQTGTLSNFEAKYLGTSYILQHKADFEPGRSSDFVLKIKFTRDLYDMDGKQVCSADEASEALALSIRDYTGPQLTIEPIAIKTGNGTVQYAGVPSVGTSPISFTDYIGMRTEQILLAWYTMAHNIKNDKIGFKEYYAQNGILYKWAPNGSRQISWKLLGCWINEYNQGQYNRQNPELRQFSTTIYYDKPVPFATPDYNSWIVAPEQSRSTGKSYSNPSDPSYIGTQTGEQEEQRNYNF